MKKLQLVSYVVANSIIATVGPGVLESPFWHLYRSRSGVDVVIKAWVLSVFLAGLLGALATRYRTADTVKWAWLIPGAIFSYPAVTYAFTRSTGFVTHFSGYDCAMYLQKHDCQAFLIFTVPLIRGLAYSAAGRLTLTVFPKVDRIWTHPRKSKNLS